MIKGFDPVRPRVIAAAVHTDALAHAASLAAGRGTVRVCSHDNQLDSCLTNEWVPLIVAELGVHASPLMLSRIMRTTKTPIIAVLPPGPLPIAQILSLAMSGVPFELVHNSSELSAAVAASPFNALESEIGEIARALSWRLDRQSLEYVVGLLVLGRRRTSVSEALARIDRPMDIRNVLREKSLPKPARILGWGAALHLIWQAERYSRDITEISRVLGFESARHCSDAFKFHTGIAPMNVIRGDGFGGIAEEFLRQLGGSSSAFGAPIRTEQFMSA
ncbi:MAG: hypothetical protein ABIR92_06520 [Gemmatimonadaceae bacterium]